MTRSEYMAAMHALGIPADTGAVQNDFDVRAAELLHVCPRTARRYRLGTSAIPGPVEVALQALTADADVDGLAAQLYVVAVGKGAFVWWHFLRSVVKEEFRAKAAAKILSDRPNNVVDPPA